MFSIQGVDDIYFDKTKDYFNEVLSSFFNGNYRSAIVMLYSTVVCDLCLKLRELENIYNDTNAKSILNQIKLSQSTDNRSSWEKELIDLVTEHNYISLKLKSDINHLYSDRCFSAHPSMDEEFELMSPSKETTIAHIKNMLDGLFIEPPTFNKNMINEITDDLEKRKTMFADDEQINQFLCTTYYKRMTSIAKASLFKNLWSFCFNKPNDEKCKNNADINRKALVYLCMHEPNLIMEARNKGFAYKISNEEWCLINLCEFLPIINCYQYVDSNDRILIDNTLLSHSNLKFISWYRYNDFDSFKTDMISFARTGFQFDLEDKIINLIKCKYENEGLFKEFLDLCILLFNNVSDFYVTLSFYNKYIRPFLASFTPTQFEKLFKVINDNRCIRDCYSFDPIEIYRTFKNKTSKNPDFKKYLFLKRIPEFIDSKNEESD